MDGSALKGILENFMRGLFWGFTFVLLFGIFVGGVGYWLISHIVEATP